jgi:hypothetical protein
MDIIFVENHDEVPLLAGFLAENPSCQVINLLTAANKDEHNWEQINANILQKLTGALGRDGQRLAIFRVFLAHEIGRSYVRLQSIKQFIESEKLKNCYFFGKDPKRMSRAKRLAKLLEKEVVCV